MVTTHSQIRQEGNLPDTVGNSLLDPHIKKAEIEIRKIITSAVYDTIEADENGSDYELLQLAEANLSLSYAVTSLNIETHGSGIVQAKGWDESRSDLLSQTEIELLREYYRDVAMELLKPIIPQPESEDDEPPNEYRGSNFRLSAI